MRSLRWLLLLLLLAGCGGDQHFFSTDITGAAFGRDFAMTDSAGQLHHLADYRGKAVVIFFGYTQCPDVCPTTLSGMAETMKRLGDDAKRVQVLFITLDPERDTREVLAAYVPQFNPSFVGLSADLPATAATAAEFKVFYQKQTGSTPKNYTIDHTATSYAYDPQGRLRLLVKYSEPPQNLAADLRVLLAGN